MVNQSPQQHRPILAFLGTLTVLFLSAAAYTLWAMPGTESQLRALESGPAPVRQQPQILNLAVAQSGIVAISASDVRRTNFPVESLSTQTVRLTLNGESVPFWVLDDGVEETLYFYAQPITHTGQSSITYQLQLGRGNSMTETAVPPTAPGSHIGTLTYLWEENNTFVQEANNAEPWYGQLLLAPDSWTLPLTDIEPTSSPGSLQIGLWSHTEDNIYPDHHVHIELNDHALFNWKWDGMRQELISLTVPRGTFQENDTNTLTISIPGDTGAVGEAVYLDWIRLNYAGTLSLRRGPQQFQSNSQNIQLQDVQDDVLIFDITDPANPERLVDVQIADNEATFAANGRLHTYLALHPHHAIRPQITAVQPTATNLMAPQEGADYLIIYADKPGFYDSLQPLIAHRTDQGLRVKAISAERLYNEFGYGQTSPEAIRQFLRHTTEEWPKPAPRYVLLVGDANYNIPGDPSLLPTPLIHTQQYGHIVNDGWYAQFEANTPPVMAIGRFPVQTNTQLQQLVAKSIAYEESDSDNAWQQRALLIADDEPIFDVYTEELNDLLRENKFDTHSFYMSQKEEIHYDLLSALNKGVGYVNYAGHGSSTMWGDEAILHSDDADMLADNGRFAVFTTFSCNMGAFAEPNRTSLAEQLLWVSNGGAVAVISPASQGSSAAHLPQAKAFYEQLTNTEVHTIGDALLLATASQNDERVTDNTLLIMFNLLGDPALTIKRP